MREFKFRMWDEKNKRWGTFVENCQPAIINTTRNGQRDIYQLRADQFVLEQFTEMVDKAGTEIYAGDIIRISASNECCSLCSTFSCDCSEFDYCRTKKDHILKSVIFDFSFLAKLGALGPGRLEVVGNRFENPELWEVGS